MALNKKIVQLGPWAILEYIIYPALSLALTPIMINKLGVSGFGTWVLMIASTSFAVTLGSGISLALSRHTSINYQENENESIEAQLDAIHLTAIISIAAAAISYILLILQDANFTLLSIAASIVVVESFDTVFSGILRGKFLNKILAKAEVVTRLVQLCCIILFISQWPTVHGVAFGYLAGSIIRVIIKFKLINIKLKSLICHKITKNSAILPSIGWASIQNIGGAMYNTFDKLIISYFFGPSALVAYSVASQLANQIQAVISAGLSVQINAVAQHVSSNTKSDFRLAYLRIMKFVIVTAIIIYSIFFMASSHIYDLWLDESVVRDTLPFVLPAILISFTQTISIPSHYMIIGIGFMRYAAMISVLASGVALVCLSFGAAFLDAHHAILAKCIYGVILALLFTRKIFAKKGKL